MRQPPEYGQVHAVLCPFQVQKFTLLNIPQLEEYMANNWGYAYWSQTMEHRIRKHNW
jgi:hypothetical protein